MESPALPNKSGMSPTKKALIFTGVIVLLASTVGAAAGCWAYDKYVPKPAPKA